MKSFFLLFVLVVALAGIASGYKVYVLSETGLHSRSNGTWTTVVPFGTDSKSGVETFLYQDLDLLKLDRNQNLGFIRGSRIGYDRSLYFGMVNTRTNGYLSTDTNPGPWSWDNSNQRYFVRYNSQLGHTSSFEFVGIVPYTVFGYPQSTSPTYVMSDLHGGGAIVVGGNFTEVKIPSKAKLSARFVALWNVTTRTWQSMGKGLDSAPRALINNADGSRLIAWTNDNTIWRWLEPTQTWARYDLALTAVHGQPSISQLALGENKLFVVGTFETINGVKCKNVSMIQFGPNGSFNVTGLGSGLPGLKVTSVYARSSTQIFIGGSDHQGVKVVYEWRAARPIPWSRLGNPGLLADDSATLDSIYSIAVAEVK